MARPAKHLLYKQKYLNPGPPSPQRRQAAHLHAQVHSTQSGDPWNLFSQLNGLGAHEKLWLNM